MKKTSIFTTIHLFSTCFTR